MSETKKYLRLTPLGEQYLKEHPPTDAKKTFEKLFKKKKKQSKSSTKHGKR